MPTRTSRRLFLADASRALLALPLAGVTGCSRREWTAFTDAASLPPEVIPALEAEVPSLLRAANVPDASIAIVASGRVAWSRGFGVQHGVSQEPASAHTRFEAGSVSKTVFAYVVMKLAERGVLDLDTPLSTYTPDRWVAGDERFAQITARHVLSHTTGLPHWRSADEPLQLACAPGSRWQYSGEGYSYLQLVIAHLAGHVDTSTCETLWDGLRVCATDMDTFMKARVLRPLGMQTSGYVWDEALADRTAGAHGLDGKPLDRPRATAVLAARFGAAGGLITTAVEYARFLTEIIQPSGTDDLRLSHDGRDAMLRPQVRVDDRSSWALGWQVLHRKSGDLISHGGDNPGFKAYTVASVPRRAGYVIFTNGDNGDEVIGQLASGDTPLNAILGG